MAQSTDPIKGWEIQASTGKHFDFLDGLRGLAILMVVSNHTFYINPHSGQLVHAFAALVSSGWMGVPIFFVLSGFLISYPFFRERSKAVQFWYLKGYTRRRIGKIIPPYYLTLIVLTIYYLIWFQDPGYILAALQWALGLPNFTATVRDFMGPYWSLVVEVHFYILLPFLFLILRGLKTLPTALGLFTILWLVPFIVRQFTWPLLPQGGDPIETSYATYFYMRRFPCQLDYFAWGVLFAGGFVFFAQARDKLRSLAWVGYAGMVFFVGVVLLDAYGFDRLHAMDYATRGSSEWFHFLPSIATFFMLFFIFDPQRWGARLLAHPWLRFVGIVSYEWFLFHLPGGYLFGYIFGQANGSFIMYLARTILPLALTFALSAVTYRYFSLPLMNWIRGDSRSRSKALSGTTVGP